LEVSAVLVAWLVVGALLLLFEMHHLAFYALFGAIGGFAAALVAVFAPSAVPLQVGVALAVAATGIVAVRPMVSRAFDARRAGFSVRGVHGGIVGHEAVTLDQVGDLRRGGHVRLTGERWLAISGSGHIVPPDTVVVVTAVQGTTLVVWPVDSVEGAGVIEAGFDELPAVAPSDSDSDEAPNGADGRTT
jgi:membrane protein implicated in regulation of membrane protease activity